jgi:membrane carboxypeptidase/penicillin-binding protein
VQQAIGSRAIRSLGADVGLDDLPDVASLALGTGVASPLQLTVAYAAFPNCPIPERRQPFSPTTRRFFMR